MGSILKILMLCPVVRKEKSNMTTSDKKGNNNKITALYCRLSVDDTDKQSDEESNSIKNQKQILQDYCKKNGYHNTRFFVDDGVSGTTFDRPGFKEMEALAEEGKIGTIIVKDLSRFGRLKSTAPQRFPRRPQGAAGQEGLLPQRRIPGGSRAAQQHGQPGQRDQLYEGP